MPLPVRRISYIDYLPSCLKVTILLFTSGKIVCVGLRRVEDVHAAIERLRAFLR